MYACMHVRTYLSIYVCMYLCMYLCIYLCIYASIYVSMSLCIYVSMYACMHICMHACLHGLTYACMHGCRYACMQVCMHGCMYACMDVCMHAWMYVCMHVCMYAWMYAWMYACIACMYACMYAWMYACMDACMYACMYACMDAWMYVCIYGCVYACTTSLSLSLPICISLHQHVAQTQTPWRPPRLRPGSGVSLLFGLTSKSPSTWQVPRIPRWSPKCRFMFQEYSIRSIIFIMFIHVLLWIRYYIGYYYVLLLLNGIDPQQVVLHASTASMSKARSKWHQDLQAFGLTPRLHSIQWAPAEHRETRWLMPGAAQVRCREKNPPIPLTVT